MSSNNNQQIIHDAKDTLATSCDPTHIPTPSLTSKKGITPRNTSPKKINVIWARIYLVRQ